jgi:glycosyltransferase involved in cell wall biosynthesis
MKIAPEISIVIPVYNREWCIARAIESAVHFVGDRVFAEIVLVDDGSIDLSSKIIEENILFYRSSFPNFFFLFHTHEKNRGVCTAKNTGARAARGSWLLFFDSDDELMPNGYSLLQGCLQQSPGDVHFFRAISESSSFVPDELDRTEKKDLSCYLLSGLGGECLPVIKRESFLRYPYDEDIRGYESLSYMRLVKGCGYLTIHSLGLRRYHTSHSERLSTNKNIRKRRNDLFKGHLRALGEHYKDAPLIWSAKQIVRAIYALIR